MRDNSRRWAVAAILLALFISLAAPPYECYVQTKAPCTDKEVGSACRTLCPNCKVTVEGTVTDRGERDAVRKPGTNEVGRVKRVQGELCTYKCTVICGSCGLTNDVAQPSGYYNVSPDPNSEECTGS